MIGKSQWCCSGNTAVHCTRKRAVGPAAAASEHTTAPIDHTRLSPRKHSPDGDTRADIRMQLSTQPCAPAWAARKLKEVLHLYCVRGYYPKSAQQGKRSYDRPVIFCIMFTIEWTRHKSSHTATLLVLFSAGASGGPRIKSGPPSQRAGTSK